MKSIETPYNNKMGTLYCPWPYHRSRKHLQTLSFVINFSLVINLMKTIHNTVYMYSFFFVAHNLRIREKLLQNDPLLGVRREPLLCSANVCVGVIWAKESIYFNLTPTETQKKHIIFTWHIRINATHICEP